MSAASPRLLSRLDRMERRKRDIERLLDSMSPAQRDFRPSEDAWSVAQVVDHVIRVERAVLEGARKPGVNRAMRINAAGQAKLFLVIGLGVRVRVPRKVGHVKADTKPIDVDDLRGRWTALRNEWREFVADFPGGRDGEMAVRHPIAGPLSYRQALWFLDGHLRHHMRQIKRIRAARGFPLPPRELQQNNKAAS